METEKLIRNARGWFRINIAAAILMFLITISSCFVAPKHMVHYWKNASAAQEKMSKFSPATQTEKAMKTLLLYFSCVVEIQRAQFIVLVLITFTFGFFATYSFIILNKLIKQLTSCSNKTHINSITAEKHKK